MAADGVVVIVRLTPRGGRDAIDGVAQLADGRSVLKVRVRAAASEGEANAALMKLIAKTLGVAGRDVSLVAMPSFHIGGVGYGVWGLRAGAKNIVVSEFDPGATLEMIETRGISDHGFIDSIYFRDPTGYVIELTAKRESHERAMDPALNRARGTLADWQKRKAI